MFYFIIIIIIIIIFLHFNISIILSCVYVSSFVDFISILIDDQVNLGTKVHLKWELNVFSNLNSHKELFITQNLYQYHGP